MFINSCYSMPARQYEVIFGRNMEICGGFLRCKSGQAQNSSVLLGILLFYCGNKSQTVHGA